MKHRCQWCLNSEIEIYYHDHIWGVPCYDDQSLYRKLVLDLMQAGLSWSTILKKEKAFDEAFDAFDILKVSTYQSEKVDELMNNSKIIRNKMKIEAAIHNASCVLNIQKAYGSFSNFLWQYVSYIPIDHQILHIKEIPSKSDLSDLISKDLKKLGFKFVGSTIIYAFMQAIGMINDHEASCYRYQEVKSFIK